MGVGRGCPHIVHSCLFVVGSWKTARRRGPGQLCLGPPAVGIVCLVVHDQLVVHEVEAVRLRLVRVKDHLAH